MDRGAQSAGQGAHRAALRDPAGPPGEGNASGGSRYDRSGESFFGNPFSSGVGAAFCGGTTSSPRCTSTAGARAAPGRNPERARRAPGSRRSHRELGWKPLGSATGRSLRGASWSAGRNRTETGWIALAAFPRPLSAPAPLPGRGAICKSFRPTACRTCRSKGEASQPNQTQIPCAYQSPLEKTVEADTSIWHKSGHFYFALTQIYGRPVLCQAVIALIVYGFLYRVHSPSGQGGRDP